LRKPPSGNEAVNMGVIYQSPGPCVHNGENPYPGAKVVRIASKLAQGMGRRLAQNTEENALVCSHNVSQLFGEGENEVEVRDGKDEIPGLSDPVPSVLGVALGAVAVAA